MCIEGNMILMVCDDRLSTTRDNPTSSISGFVYTVIGTTLPDLQCIFHVDLAEVSSLFVPLGLATAGACLLSTIFIRKCNIYLLIAIVVLVGSVAIALVAITPFLAVALVALIFVGFALGVVMTSCVFESSRLFSDTPCGLHVVMSAYSAGNFLSPLLAKPFLGSSEEYNNFSENVSIMNTSLTHQLKDSRLSSLSWQETDILKTTYNSSVDTQFSCDNYTTEVNYFFIITGILGLPLSFSLYIWFLKRSDGISVPTPNESYTQLKSAESRWTIIFLVMVSISLTISYGMPFTYGSYITTIGVNGTLHLDIQKAALLMSLFWMSFFFGRLAATTVSHYMRQTVIIYVCCIGEILTLSILVATGGPGEVGFWIASLCLAFFSGPMIASVIAWSREYIELTSFILGVMLLADYVGTTIHPYVSGQLISIYGERALYVYCLGLSLLQVLITCVLQGLGKIEKLYLQNTTD